MKRVRAERGRERDSRHSCMRRVNECVQCVGVSFGEKLALTTVELIQWSVVVYKFPLQSVSKACCSMGTFVNARSTALYLTKQGPVYNREASSSSSTMGGSSRAASCLLAARKRGRSARCGSGLRMCSAGKVPDFSTGYAGMPNSLSPWSGSATNHHSIRDVVVICSRTNNQIRGIIRK